MTAMKPISPENPRSRNMWHNDDRMKAIATDTYNNRRISAAENDDSL